MDFLRNLFSTTPKKNSQLFREQVKALFRIKDIEQARRFKEDILRQFKEDKHYFRACERLDEGFEDAFQYTVVGPARARLRGTNFLERLNQEVIGREKVIRIFSNVDSATRLIGAVLMLQEEEWISSSRSYMNL